MSDGTTFKQCGCRDRPPASRSAASARSCGAATAGATATAPGTTRSSCRRAPTAPAAPRCATAASPPTPPPRPSWTWPGNCWPSPRPATCRPPSGSPTPSPPPCATPARSPTPTGSASRSAPATTPPSARPPIGEWLEEWLAAKKKLRPGTVRSYAGPHPPVPQAPPRAHPHRPAPGHRRRLRCSTTSRNSTTRSPRPAPAGSPAARAAVKGRRRVGPATCQRIRATLRSALSTYMKQHPGALPANVASLVELPPGTRPKALVWTGERVRAWQKDFDAAAGRRPRGRRAGQPGRHLDLRAPPVAGHGLDPRPDHGVPRRRPPAPAARPVAADRHPGTAPRRGLRAAPPRHRPRRGAVHDPLADHPARLGPRPGRPQVRRRRAHRRPRRRHRHRHGRLAAGTGQGERSRRGRLGRLRVRVHRRAGQPAAPRRGHRRLPHARLPRRAAAHPAARPAPRRRHPAAGRRARHEGRPGNPRPVVHHHRRRHLHQRAAPARPHAPPRTSPPSSAPPARPPPRPAGAAGQRAQPASPRGKAAPKSRPAGR